MLAHYKTETETRYAIRLLAWMVLVATFAGISSAVLRPWIMAVLTVWFLRCLEPPRGFAFVYLANFVVLVVELHGRSAPIFSRAAVAACFASAPFLIDRFISARSIRFASTLFLPLLALSTDFLARIACTPVVYGAIALGHGQERNSIVAPLTTLIGVPGLGFLMLWYASALNWTFESSPRLSRGLFRSFSALLWCIPCLVYTGALLSQSGSSQAFPLGTTKPAALLAAIAAFALGVWVYAEPRESGAWLRSPLAMSILRSPKSGTALQLVKDAHGEILVSEAGEQIPVLDGIPRFCSGEEISGLNSKFSKLYDLFGGFYDEATRVEGLLRNGGENAIRRGWMQCVHVQPGDRVLETSVGSSANLKLLPRKAEYFGLDLSGEMLRRGRYSVERWGGAVRLMQGNAEMLPFQDEVFDVVYHVGSINFFSDPARAIHEMIRVARPGAWVVIADEVEKDIKVPMVSRVPGTMKSVHTQTVSSGAVYIVTFQKPSAESPGGHFGTRWETAPAQATHDVATAGTAASAVENIRA